MCIFALEPLVRVTLNGVYMSTLEPWLFVCHFKYMQEWDRRKFKPTEIEFGPKHLDTPSVHILFILFYSTGRGF